MEQNGDYRLFADCHCTLSESPMWNHQEQMLYWRGFEGELYRKSYESAPDQYECFQLEIGPIGSMVFTDSNYILLFADGGKIWKWIPGENPELYKDFKSNLFNDCLVDPKGRIYCGMLTEHFFDETKRGRFGSFWRFDPDGSLHCIDNRIGAIPNGIRFSPDMTKLYFGVTDTNVIYSYDYDRQTGALCNRKIVVKDCFPDGIAVDVDGNIWVANCNPGNPVQCFTSHGELIKEYYFPVHRPISVAFGGPDNKSLFVTTALEGRPVGTHDGGVFVIEKTIGGAKEYILHTKQTTNDLTMPSF